MPGFNSLLTTRYCLLDALARWLLSTFVADAVDLKTVPSRYVMVLAPDLLLDLLNLRREELHRTSAIRAHHVMVIPPVVLVLVTRHPIVERHLARQPTFRQ